MIAVEVERNDGIIIYSYKLLDIVTVTFDNFSTNSK